MKARTRIFIYFLCCLINEPFPEVQKLADQWKEVQRVQINNVLEKSVLKNALAAEKCFHVPVVELSYDFDKLTQRYVH